MMVIDIAE